MTPEMKVIFGVVAAVAVAVILFGAWDYIRAKVRHGFFNRFGVKDNRRKSK